MSTPNLATFKVWRSALSSRGAFMAVFFFLIAAAWVLLFALSLSHGGVVGGYDAEGWSLILNPSYLATFCLLPAAEAGVATDIAMWAMMAIGMMLPTTVPIVETYCNLADTQPRRTGSYGVWGLLGGYAAVWFIFSIAAGLLQWSLAKSGLVSTHGMSLSAPLSISLLLVAGAYQFSPLKAACLARCRSPLVFFMSQWRDGPWGALRMGLRHGLDCLGCCWALMLLAFVGGTMNLIWMGLATGLMILEKLPDIGRPLTKPLGVLLIGCALFIGWVELIST